MKAYITGRIKAFRYVFRGMGWMLRHEASIQVQALLMLVSAGLSWWMQFNLREWLVFVFIWGFIFTTETLNTAVEKLADVVSPGYDERIRDVKDISAGAVGWAAVAGGIAYFLLILNHFK